MNVENTARKMNQQLSGSRERNFDTSEFPNLGKMAIYGDKYSEKQEFPFKLKNLTNPRPQAHGTARCARTDYSSDFYDENLPNLEMLKIANNYPKMLLSQIGHEKRNMDEFLVKRNKEPYYAMLRAESAGMERPTRASSVKFNSKDITYSRLSDVCSQKVHRLPHVSKSRLEYEERLDAALSVSKASPTGESDFMELATALNPPKHGK